MNRSLNSFVMVICGLLAIGWLAPTARAALIAYEGFDFEGGQINGKGSGFGFSGNWINTTSPFLNVSTDNVSLDSSAFPFDPVGNRVESTGGAARRVLANTYDLNQDGAPFYLSFLLRKSDVGVIAASNVEVALFQGNTAILRVGSSSSNAGPNANQSLFFSNVPGGGTVNTAIPVVYGDTYFLVVKGVPSASGSDQLFASIYGPSATVPLAEPGGWDINRTFSSTVTLSELRATLGNSAAGSVDEIRIGDSWASVTALPEPSATLFVFLFGAVGACVRRRGASEI